MFIYNLISNKFSSEQKPPVENETNETEKPGLFDEFYEKSASTFKEFKEDISSYVDEKVKDIAFFSSNVPRIEVIPPGGVQELKEEIKESEEPGFFDELYKTGSSKLQELKDDSAKAKESISSYVEQKIEEGAKIKEEISSYVEQKVDAAKEEIFTFSKKYVREEKPSTIEPPKESKKEIPAKKAIPAEKPGPFAGAFSRVKSSIQNIKERTIQVKDKISSSLDEGIKGVVGRVFSSEDPNVYRETLVRLSGNNDTAELIDSLVPKLSASIMTKMMKDYSIFKSFLEGQEQLFEALIRTALFKFAVHIALDIENKTKKGDEAVVIPHLSSLILSNATGIFKKHFDVVQPSYHEIAAIKNDNERQKRIKEAFGPLADELLQIGLPDGLLKKDMFFSPIKDTLIDHFHIAYQQSVNPAHHKESDLLVYNEEGGEALRELVKFATQKGLEKAKEACGKDCHKIVSYLDPYLTGDKTFAVKAHVAEELKHLTQSDDPQVAWILSLLSNKLESFGTRIVGHLVATSPYKAETNVAAKALKNLLDIVDSLAGKKGKPFIDGVLQSLGLENDPLIAQIKDEGVLDLIETLYEKAASLYLKPPLRAAKPLDILDLLKNEKENSELEKGCAILATDVRDVVIKYINNNQDYVAKSISELLGHNETTKAGLELAAAINSVLTSNDKSTEKALGFAETILKNSLFKVFSSLSENVEGPINQEKIANGLHRILGILSSKIPVLDEQVRSILNKGLPQEAQEAEMNELFAPIAEEILAIVGNKVLDALPIGDALKPFAAKGMQKTLTSLLSKFYLDLTAPQREVARNGEELAQKMSNAPEGIAKITDYVGKYVPFYLKKHADKIAHLVVGKGNKYFDLLGKEKKGEFETLISKSIKNAAQDKAMNPLWQGVASYAEASLTKIFLSTAKNIEQAEGHQKTPETNPLLISLLMGGMFTGEGHFKRISNLQNQKGEVEAHKLSHEELLRDFQSGGALHPALMKDLDPNATAEEKKAQRLELFFKPLAKNLIAIAGLDNKENYPIPEALKKTAMEALEEEILPEILMEIYGEVQKPENLNKIMSNMIDTLEKTCNSLFDVVEEGDSHQVELNEQIGNLMKSFVSMMPESASKTLFSIKEINKLSAAKIGNIVRMKTNATTLLDVFNILLKDVELKAPDVNDHRTADEIKQEQKDSSFKLQSKMTSFISKQAEKTVRHFVSGTWNSFQRNFDNGVEKYLGAPGKAVKGFLDFIFGGIMRLVLPIFDFIIFDVLWKFFELHVWNKAGEVVNNTKMPIHENMMFEATEGSIRAIRTKLEEARAAQSALEKKEALEAKRIEKERLHAQMMQEV